MNIKNLCCHTGDNFSVDQTYMLGLSGILFQLDPLVGLVVRGRRSVVAAGAAGSAVPVTVAAVCRRRRPGGAHSGRWGAAAHVAVERVRGRRGRVLQALLHGGDCRLLVAEVRPHERVEASGAAGCCGSSSSCHGSS